MPILYIAVMAVAFLLDRVVKNWAAGPLVDVHGGVLPLIPGVFQFTYAENRGAAFSILQGRTWLLIVLTAVICLVGLYFLFFSRRRLPAESVLSGLWPPRTGMCALCPPAESMRATWRSIWPLTGCWPAAAAGW